MGRYKNWTTREGIKIPINKMTDSHLANSIKYLERYAIAYKEKMIIKAYCFEATLNGEMAIDAIQSEIHYMENCDDPIGMLPEKLENLYYDMHNLAIKRRLVL